MTSGKKNKAMRNARSSVAQQRSFPWLTIAGVGVIVVLAAVIFGFVYMQHRENSASEAAQAEADAAAAPFKPSPQNPDPSKKIPGVVTARYPGGQHVNAQQRVAYDKAPPFGGPHDQIWADCTGVVYPQAVRNENMVHSLEHGAVWIAYNPEKLGADGVQQLARRAQNRPYTMLSPYPGLDSPISLQSWGHQLKLDAPDDPRIDQFITALRQNPNNVYPEVGGSCQAIPGGFDTQNPPPFNPAAPPPDAVSMSGEGAQSGGGEMGGGR